MGLLTDVGAIQQNCHMVDERFPLRKYLRQLANMDQDFSAWANKYRRVGAFTDSDVMAGRYTDRAELLEGMRVQLHAMFHELEQLPRLS